MELLAGTGFIAASARALTPMGLSRPTTCADALEVLRNSAEAPTLVAGGTDLAAQINEGCKPHLLLSLDRVAELRKIEITASEVRIGSGVTHARGSRDPDLVAHLPGFADAWRRIANVRVRFWATIGGNLMARRTRYEMSLLLTALGATLHFETPAGPLTLRPDSLWTSPLLERALLHHIAIPRADGARFVYDRSLRPIMTLAINLAPDARRAVIATEWLPPLVLPIAAGNDAKATFAALPDSYHDVATSAWYLRRAGQALLDRHLQERAHG